MFQTSLLLALAIVLSLSVCPNECLAQPEPPKGQAWQAVPELSDEFDGERLDAKKWTADPEGHPDFGWIGRPPGLFQEQSVRLKGGMLQIQVGKLPETVVSNKYKTPSTYDYHGGIVRALTPTNPGHYYECRMKMNKTEMGGGFWIMSKNTPGKKHEIDITESVGKVSDDTAAWGKRWDQIMHSNAIWRSTALNPKPVQHQNQMFPKTKNSEQFYRYGCWWKSPRELRFYLDDEYVYSIEPPTDFDQDMFLHISIECYDWNPIPEDGGLVASASEEDRTTLFDYVRTFKLATGSTVTPKAEP